jgi:hypothetical protein
MLPLMLPLPGRVMFPVLGRLRSPLGRFKLLGNCDGRLPPRLGTEPMLGLVDPPAPGEGREGNCPADGRLKEGVEGRLTLGVGRLTLGRLMLGEGRLTCGVGRLTLGRAPPPPAGREIPPPPPRAPPPPPRPPIAKASLTGNQHARAAAR